MEQLNSLTIYLTERCNFNCSYCYYRKESGDTLTLEQLKKGLNHFFNQIKDTKQHIYVTIMGGEPLLEKKLMFQAIDIINNEKEKRKLMLETNVFTNGSMLTNELAKKIIGKDVKVSISIDGIKKSNDSYRKIKGSNKSTYDLVSERIKALSNDVKVKTYINMVFTPETCKYITESFKQISTLGVYSIDVSLSTYDNWDLDALNILKKEGVKFIKYYVSLFSENSKQKPFHMYQVLNLKDSNWRSGLKCSRIKLGPDGYFYFCDSFFSVNPELRKKYNIGNVEYGINIKKRESMVKSIDIALNKHFGETYSLYRCQKRTICPYLIYTYAKIKNKDFKKRLANLNRVSRIYSRIFLLINHLLKENSAYKKLYNVSEDAYYEKHVRPVVR